MTRMRKASVVITYNGEDITLQLQQKTDKFTYCDPESGSSDDISLSVVDSDEKWINEHFPSLEDKIEAKISVSDWCCQGDNRTLRCGVFIIDDPGFSGPPCKVSFKAVSKPAEGCFTATKRTQTWENVTVQNMAQEIAERSGLSLQYEADNIKITSKEQNEQVDSEFLRTTCEEYGLSLKIYSNRLVVFDREKYKAAEPIAVLCRKDYIKWSYNATLAGTYTGGTMKFTDPDTEEEIEAKVGTDKRLLSVSGKADSQADAERKIKATVNKANEDSFTLSLTVFGNPDMVSSQCVTVGELGVANGKYYIKKATHSIGSSGYTTALEMCKVVESL